MIAFGWAWATGHAFAHQDSREDTHPCAVALRQAMALRGFSVAIDEVVPGDAPSVVDHVCRERIARSVDVMVALTAERAHVEAPFLTYRDARVLAHNALKDAEPLCYLARGIDRAAARHNRLRWSLLGSVLLGALSFMALFIRTRRRIRAHLMAPAPPTG